MSLKRLLVAGLMLLCIVSYGVPAGWAAEAGDSSTDQWTFKFAPYVWATGLKGTTSTLPPLPSADVNASFSDIIKDLNLAFMGTGEMRKGRFGILADVFWTKVTSDVSAPVGVFFSGGTLESETLMTTVAGAYRVAEDEHGWVDLVAGIRGYYVNTDLNVRAGLLPGRTISSNVGWVDGLAGLRGQLHIWRGLYANATTLVGGGGSDIMVDLTGGLGYQFNRLISTFAGYRYAKVDYNRSSGFVWDVEYKGPLLGVAFTF